MTWRGWLFLAAVAVVFCARQWSMPIVVPPVNERDLILESSLDDQWVPAAEVGIVGPGFEEILFRGLFFARCARFLGVGPAVVASGLAFALGHGSAAPGAMMMGMVFAGLYTTTGTLLVPIALHSALNSSLLWNGRQFSPMVRHSKRRERKPIALVPRTPLLLPFADCVICLLSWFSAQAPLDTVAEAFERKFTQLKHKGFLSCVSRSEIASLLAFVKLQPQPQWRQQTVSNARCVFSALDRHGKGSLGASEIAWLMTLRPDEPRLLNASLGVIERRVGGSPEHLDAVQRNMDCMPSDLPLLEQPRARFIPDANRLVLIDQTVAAAGSRRAEEPKSFAPFVQRQNAAPLAPIEPRIQSVQSELLHRYYSTQWSTFYRVHFPSGCSADAFESFFCRAFPSLDEQMKVLWTLRTDDEGTHPVAKLLEEHRNGRQSFGGVTRRRPTTDVAPAVAPINPTA